MEITLLIYYLKVTGLSLLILFCVVGIIFLITPMPRYVKMTPCDCEDEVKPVDQPLKEKPLVEALIVALRSYNIKHNTRGLAQQVVNANPDVDDLDALIGLAFKTIREKYR